MQISQFRNPQIGSLACLALALSATMEEATVKEPTNDYEFSQQFAAKMEAREIADAAAAGKPAEVVDDEIEEEEVEGAADDEAAGGGTDDDELEEEGEGEEVDELEEEVVKDEKDGKDGKKVDALAKLAERLGLAPLLEDLPDALRPILTKRLKDVDAHFTRTQQKATEFRAEQRKFEVEERYRADNPVDFLAEMLMKDPSLEEKVAAQLEKLQADPTHREAAKVVAKDRRAEAGKKVDASERELQDKQDWVVRRGTEVTATTKAACKSLDIPFDRGVESAIAYEIREHDDITDERIKEIVKDLAAERQRSSIATRREEKKRHIAGKTEAKKAAAPLRPGQGRAGGSTRPQEKELTLEQQMTATAERLFPGEK